VRLSLPNPRAEIRLLRFIGAAGWLLSAVSSYVTTRVPDPDPSDHTGMLITGGIELAIGLALLLGRRLPRWLVKTLVVYAGLLMTSVVAAIERPLGAVPFYYVYPAFTGSYFGTRADTVAVLALIGLTFPVSLSVNESAPVPALYFTSVMTIVTLVAVFIRWITERVDGLVIELERAALTDPLTGLPNRRSLQGELPQRIERAVASGLPLSLVDFDLDHFKRLNDRYGHDAGDEALRTFAQLLQSESRQGDLVARMGGEEFTAVLFGASTDSARRFAERICELLSKYRVAGEARLSTSAGVASLGIHGSTAEELLIAADRALYAAKVAGRARVVTAGEAIVGPLSAA